MLSVIIGLQWGDEGKGRVCDELARDADIVVKFNGGPNSIHTIRTSDLTLNLRQMPSAVLHSDVLNVLGDGTVVDLRILKEELHQLEKMEYPIQPSLLISKFAHVITPYDSFLDRLRDSTISVDHKTSTWSGIAPVYADKATREGLRMGDLLDRTGLAKRLERYVWQKERQIRGIYGQLPPSATGMLAAYHEYSDLFKDLITDVGKVLRTAQARGKSILFEGSQGTMLDLCYGSYPFVTSSFTTSGAIFVGSGLPPQQVDQVIGVFKPYNTKVGAGPFPTETPGLNLALAEKYRAGWLDLVSLKYALEINGCTTLALTNLDRLSQFDEINIAVAYEVDNERIEEFSWEALQANSCLPIYRKVRGWGSSIAGITVWKQLPKEAKAFIKMLETELDLELGFISTGPKRDDTLKNTIFGH